MRQYYKPKWKMYQEPISREALRNNVNLRRFLRIKTAVFAFNFIASIAILALIFTEVL